MKRIALRLGLTTLLILSLCLPLTGCGEFLHELFVESREEREERVYRETIDAIFTALDAGDADGLLGLFSEEARHGDPDLEADIAYLMKVYKGPYVTNGFDGLLGGGASFEPEGKTYNIFNSVAVQAGDTYYWIYLKHTYQCDTDPGKIGITNLAFFTADEWSLYLYDEDDEDDEEREDSLGLTVYADKTLDGEWHCIYGKPIQYTPREAIDPDEAVAQLNKTDSFSAFKEVFGEPAGSWVYHYYPLPDEGGEARWLCVGAVEKEDWIYGIFVVDRFAWVEELWDNPREG